MPLESLEDFQGALKVLPAEAFSRMRRLIIKRGFSFPVFVWGGNRLLDGHQRLSVVRRMIADEGYTLAGEIPVCDIAAKTEKEAAEKLLELQGSHGQITDYGLLEFVENFDLDLDVLAADIDLSDIDLLGLIDVDPDESFGKLYRSFNDISGRQADDQATGGSTETDAGRPGKIPVTIFFSEDDHRRWLDFKARFFAGAKDKTVLTRMMKKWGDDHA